MNSLDFKLLTEEHLIVYSDSFETFSSTQQALGLKFDTKWGLAPVFSSYIQDTPNCSFMFLLAELKLIPRILRQGYQVHIKSGTHQLSPRNRPPQARQKQHWRIWGGGGGRQKEKYKQKHIGLHSSASFHIPGFYRSPHRVASFQTWLHSDQGM